MNGRTIRAVVLGLMLCGFSSTTRGTDGIQGDVSIRTHGDSENEYRFGVHRFEGRDWRSFIVRISAGSQKELAKRDLSAIAESASRTLFDKGATLSDPGFFKTFDLEVWDALIMGARAGDGSLRWFAVARISETSVYQVWRDGRIDGTAAAGALLDISDTRPLFRVYLLEGRVRFAFLPDGAADIPFVRLVGRYNRDPIRAADEQFAYIAVLANGAFDRDTADAAVELGISAAKRYGLTLANPGRLQEPIRLGPDRCLVLMVYDSARRDGRFLPVRFAPDGRTLLTLDLATGPRWVPLDPQHEWRLGGFRIPIVFGPRGDFELGYTVRFPRSDAEAASVAAPQTAVVEP